MKTKTLKAFCIDRNVTAFEQRFPYCDGRHVYATDNAIIIRVPARGKRKSPRREKPYPNARSMFETYQPKGSPRAWPSVSNPKKHLQQYQTSVVKVRADCGTTFYVQSKYARLIAALPGTPQWRKTGRWCDPLYVKFRGGEVLVMPYNYEPSASVYTT